MIEGMKLGRYYNQDGNEAFGNETRLTLDDLNRYLGNLGSTGNSHNYKYLQNFRVFIEQYQN